MMGCPISEDLKVSIKPLDFVEYLIGMLKGLNPTRTCASELNPTEHKVDNLP